MECEWTRCDMCVHRTIEVVVIESPRHELTVELGRQCVNWLLILDGEETHTTTRRVRLNAKRLAGLVGSTFLTGKVQIIPPHEHRLPHTLLATA